MPNVSQRSAVPAPTPAWTSVAPQHDTSSLNPRKLSVSSAPTPLRADGDQQAVRKALIRWNENPSNFHQAACVFLLGGAEGHRKYNFPRPENISRMTNPEMKLAWENASNSISKTEQLVCRFMNMRVAGKSLGVESPGLRAATVGQGGGGLYVCDCGPHELGWEPWQTGDFREKAGRELYGEKWQDVLEGGQYEDRLDVVFFLKVPSTIYERAQRVPGRPNNIIIPHEVLYEQDGHYWLPKQKIVKTYLLKRGQSHLQIPGEGAPPGASLQVKVLFAALSLAVVLLQAVSLYVILFNTQNPSCVTNMQCPRGMWCTAHPGESGSGRCDYCATTPRWGTGLNATSFCSDEQNQNELYCDESTGFADLKCSHPACRACPGLVDGRPNPGWGTAYYIAASRVNATLHPDDKWFENSTWGTISSHTEVRANINSMQATDMCVYIVAVAVVSFKLAEETRDIMLCETTISQRGGSNHWSQTSYVDWVIVIFAAGITEVGHLHMFSFGGWTHMKSYLGHVLLAANQLLFIPVIWSIIDIRCDNSPWRVFLISVNAIRRYTVLTLLTTTVPTFVLFGSYNAKDIALNTVGSLFILDLDNLAFKYAIPCDVRMHVEEYGRAALDDAQIRVISSVKMWTWVQFSTAMILILLFAKYLHDPAGGWGRGPNWPLGGGLLEANVLAVCCSFGLPSIFAGILSAGEPILKHCELKQRTAWHGSVCLLVFATMSCGFYFSYRMTCCGNDSISGTGLWTFLWSVLACSTAPVLWMMDRRDGGSRLSHFGGQLVRFWVGSGFGIVVQLATQISWSLWSPL